MRLALGPEKFFYLPFFIETSSLPLEQPRNKRYTAANEMEAPYTVDVSWLHHSGKGKIRIIIIHPFAGEAQDVKELSAKASNHLLSTEKFKTANHIRT